MTTSPLRSSPLNVGLTLREVPVSPPEPSEDSIFDAHIMHRVVPATLTHSVVTRDASDLSISSAFRLPVSLVRNEWLTSRTPVIDPRIQRDEMPFLYRGRAPVDLAAVQRFRDLAADLRVRLQDILDDDVSGLTPADRRKYYAAPVLEQEKQQYSKKEEFSLGESNVSRTADTGLSTSDTLCAAGCALSETSEISTDYADEERCGFAARDRHPDLMRDGAMLVRTGGGLYRTARHANGIGKGESFYTELYVNYSGGTGGIATGVCVGDIPLTKMVGGETGSVALHSSANVVHSGTWDASGHHFGTGDVIGVLVEVSQEGKVLLTVTINGEYETEITDEQMDMMVAQGKRVHFAVSLYRVGSRVSLRCCAKEWHFAPFGERRRLKPLCQGFCENVKAETKVGKVETTKKIDAQCTSVLTPWL